MCPAFGASVYFGLTKQKMPYVPRFNFGGLYYLSDYSTNMSDITDCGVCAAGGPCFEHPIPRFPSEWIEENSTHSKCNVCDALLFHRLIDEFDHCAECAQLFCVICKHAFVLTSNLKDDDLDRGSCYCTDD